MVETVNKLTAHDKIQAQLRDSNSQILAALPSLKNETIFGDFTRAISYILGGDINASGLIEALRQERLKSTNNSDYNPSKKESA